MAMVKKNVVNPISNEVNYTKQTTLINYKLFYTPKIIRAVFYYIDTLC